MLAGKMFRQSRLTMSSVERSGRWIWEEAIDNGMRRKSWPYARRRNAEGEWVFMYQL